MSGLGVSSEPNKSKNEANIYPPSPANSIVRSSTPLSPSKSSNDGFQILQEHDSAKTSESSVKDDEEYKRPFHLYILHEEKSSDQLLFESPRNADENHITSSPDFQNSENNQDKKEKVSEETDNSENNAIALNRIKENALRDDLSEENEPSNSNEANNSLDEYDHRLSQEHKTTLSDETTFSSQVDNDQLNEGIHDIQSEYKKSDQATNVNNKTAASPALIEAKQKDEEITVGGNGNNTSNRSSTRSLGAVIEV